VIVQIDDVAHTDAAFNSDPNPESAAKDVEAEVSCITFLVNFVPPFTKSLSHHTTLFLKP